jgi:hypothetical protein
MLKLLDWQQSIHQTNFDRYHFLNAILPREISKNSVTLIFKLTLCSKRMNIKYSAASATRCEAG